MLAALAAADGFPAEAAVPRPPPGATFDAIGAAAAAAAADTDKELELTLAIETAAELRRPTSSSSLALSVVGVEMVCGQSEKHAGV